jgi:hypothetical protein
MGMDFLEHAHRLTADIWMPNFCVELHDWGSKWVVIGNPNVNLI